MMTVDRCVFQKFSRFGVSVKFLLGQEPVIFAFNFAGAPGARCARNRISELRCLAECVNQGRFSSSRRRRKNEKNSGAIESATQGSGFVRGFSRARPCKPR